MKKIIVHGGGSHLDEVIAAALCMCEKSWDSPLDDVNGSVPIYRRNPTEEELNDAETIVLDVGRRLDVTEHNWDHHQLERGTKECAYSLVAKDLLTPDGVPFDGICRELFPWWDTRVELDSCGPFASAKSAGVEWGTVSKFMGPLEGLWLDMFERPVENCSEDEIAVIRGNLVFATMTRMINEKVKNLALVKAGTRIDDVNGVRVIDMTAPDPEVAETVSDAIVAPYPDGVVIFHSRPRAAGETWQSTGLTLLRLKDDPKIDFSRVEGDPEVGFAHKGGFIACTKSKDVQEALRLIRAATLA